MRQQTVRSGDSAVLQDLQLSYDPVGNVVHVHDDGISPSFFDNQQQQPDWDHTYDPLYRLVTATGRESAIDDQDPVPSWVTSGSGFGPTPPPSGTAARNYVQQIAYDPVGNLSSVQHFVPGQSSASWTRLYSYPADSNRLSSDTVGGVTASYGYDSAGNMSSMPHLPGSGGTAGLEWSWANQLAQTYSSSSAVARYAYGGDGERVVKRFGSLSGSVLTPSKITVYLPGGFEITGSFSGGALQVEWQSLAVMDDRACVARFEVKTVDGGVATGESAVLRYQVGNHLGSACLETTDAGEVLTREEYYPYGGTAYAFAASGAAGFSVKRYRYAGKECDSENGLYYFGARYFAAWLGRWTAGDPVFAAGRSAYEYCHSNPTTKVDPDGRWPRNNHEELAVRNPEAFAAQGRIGAPAALTAIGIAVSAVGVGYAFAAFGPAAGAVALADEAFGHATGIPISPSSAVRIARNPIKAVEQTVDVVKSITTAVRRAESGAQVAVKVEVKATAAAHAGAADMKTEFGPNLDRIGGAAPSRAAPKLLPAPRQIEAAWGASVYRHGGLMSGIEHIMYRHSASSGFANVSRFSEGTTARNIVEYVDQALRYGRVTQTAPGAFMVDRALGRTIGTNMDGNAAAAIRVFVRDGIIQTAFPF